MTVPKAWQAGTPQQARHSDTVPYLVRAPPISLGPPPHSVSECGPHSAPIPWRLIKRIEAPPGYEPDAHQRAALGQPVGVARVSGEARHIRGRGPIWEALGEF